MTEAVSVPRREVSVKQGPDTKQARNNYENGLMGGTDGTGSLLDMLRKGLTYRDFTSSKSYSLEQLNEAREGKWLDTHLLVAIDEEQLPPGTLFRCYTSPVDDKRRGEHEVVFDLLRGDKTVISPTEIATIPLEVAYEPYYEPVKLAKDGRFHLVLSNAAFRK